ncbi:hypothetical protein GRI91_02875 [Altererythrobacter endophyticus]|uniref:Globin n=2 Tax=Altericroceibacterium endophyticum TaxID=1808508 RepID=A0A6I4T311_9SPHN|nr:hypothetical protein [Altericroceibacterium endophyticum]
MRKQGRDHVTATRQAKRAAAEALGVDAAFIDAMVERFYGLIREDETLGPIFASRVEDWPAHLDRMKQFWRSILHNSGEYSGNPMRKHVMIEGVEEAHFQRWLALFYANLRAMEVSEAGREIVALRARAIADSLLTGIVIHRSGLLGGRAGKNLPHYG